MSAPSRPRDWDAATYDRCSDAQHAWGLEVLERLPLRGDETVLDAGCGTGRVTKALAERLARGRVVAVDGSPAMVAQARAALGERAEVLVADLLELELEQPVDAIVSTAVFHWITDHDRLFARLHAALRPGGVLAAQCGGEGNVASLLAAVAAVTAREPFAEHFSGWSGTWYFAGPGETRERLEATGFEGVETWLERRDVTPDEPREYLRTVTLGAHLDRLPPALHEPFLDAVLADLPRPLTLDYVRLNIHARRGR